MLVAILGRAVEAFACRLPHMHAELELHACRRLCCKNKRASQDMEPRTQKRSG